LISPWTFSTNPVTHINQTLSAMSSLTIYYVGLKEGPPAPSGWAGRGPSLWT